MKKYGGLLLSVSAAVLYSVETSIIKEKLSGIDPVKLTIFFYLLSPLVIPVMFFIGIVFFRESTGTNLSLVSITATQWGFIFFCLAVEMVADFFWIKAYSIGASIALVTSVMTALPVFAIVINSIWRGQLPSLKQFVCCLIISASIWFMGVDEV